MAGRTKKTDETIENATIAENSEVIKSETKETNTEKADIDLLKQENERLRNQLEKFLNDGNKTNSEPEPEKKYVEINPLKPIKVISLTVGGINLKTSNSGNGKIFRFDKFGHPMTISYSDLQDVIAVNRSFIEDGSVYICDEDVIKNNYLDKYYEQFLTFDTINNILSFPTDQIVEMVANTTEAIQETIISLLVSKINNNEFVDMNKVTAIGQSCKTPCDIMGLALKKRSDQ